MEGLSSTQIGAIGENLLVNAVMQASKGRLSPFSPIADDNGIDVLFFDKLSGGSVAIQLKCRTRTLRKRNSEERGNVTHFEVRKATFSDSRRAWLVGALLNKGLTELTCSWFIPLDELPTIAREQPSKFVIRANKASGSKDRFAGFRCTTPAELAARILKVCEGQASLVAAGSGADGLS